jgi:hypothetical protein
MNDKCSKCGKSFTWIDDSIKRCNFCDEEFMVYLYARRDRLKTLIALKNKNIIH